MLLVFWATWCARCKQQMPMLRRLHKDYAGTKPAIAGIRVYRHRGTLSSFLRKISLPWTILHDASGGTAKARHAGGIPYTLLIDKKSIVVRIWPG